MANPQHSLRQLSQIVPQNQDNSPSGLQSSYSYSESKHAVACRHKHFLDQLDDRGYFKFKADESGSEALADQVSKPKIPLYLCVSLTDIKDIDINQERFSFCMRLYAMWDLNALESRQVLDSVSNLAQRLRMSGNYVSLKADEVKSVQTAISLPTFIVFNRIDFDAIDEDSIRVYLKPGDSNTLTLMWNNQYNVVARERYELHNFPFDCQDLVRVSFTVTKCDRHTDLPRQGPAPRSKLQTPFERHYVSIYLIVISCACLKKHPSLTVARIQSLTN